MEFERKQTITRISHREMIAACDLKLETINGREAKIMDRSLDGDIGKEVCGKQAARYNIEAIETLSALRATAVESFTLRQFCMAVKNTTGPPVG